MKILYMSPAGKKNGYNSHGEKQLFDLETTSNTISEGIVSYFPNAEITMIYDIANDPAGIDCSVFDSFDLYLCDLTTGNANVAYHAGQAERNGKPIIYFVSSDTSFPVAFSSKRILKYSEASLENEFQEGLKELIILAKKSPSSVNKKPNELATEAKAFISYSHSDKQYLDRLMVHLKPLVRKGLVDVWEDSQIKTGDQWQKEIEKALSKASIAILLISADFMASDFIIDNELPPLLSKAEVNGTSILPVILSPCRFTREPTLSRFQAANPPSEPLSLLGKDEREKIYDKLAEDIELSLNKA